MKFGVTWEKQLSLSPDIHSALSAQVQVVYYNFAASPVALDQGTKKSPKTECVIQRKHEYSEHVGDKAIEIIGLPSDVTDRI